MSQRMMSWAWHEAPVTNPTELLVLLALADEADDDGESCYPSVRRLAAKSRLSTGGVIAAVDRLEAASVIDVARPEKRAPGRSNHYRIRHGQGLAPPRDPQTVHQVNSDTAWLDRSRDAQKRSSGERNRSRLRASGATDPLTPAIADPSTTTSTVGHEGLSTGRRRWWRR